MPLLSALGSMQHISEQFLGGRCEQRPVAPVLEVAVWQEGVFVT